MGLRYLGLLLGNILPHCNDEPWGLTPEEAFVATLHESFRGAGVVSTLNTSVDEKAFMLIFWILPLVTSVAKVYFAPDPVTSEFEQECHMTVGTKLGCYTAHPLKAPSQRGLLPGPKLFSMHRAATPFLSLLKEQHKFPQEPVDSIHRWATASGFMPSADNLPYFQCGMVRSMYEACSSQNGDCPTFDTTPHHNPPSNWLGVAVKASQFIPEVDGMPQGQLFAVSRGPVAPLA